MTDEEINKFEALLKAATPQKCVIAKGDPPRCCVHDVLTDWEDGDWRCPYGDTRYFIPERDRPLLRTTRIYGPRLIQEIRRLRKPYQEALSAVADQICDASAKKLVEITAERDALRVEVEQLREDERMLFPHERLDVMRSENKILRDEVDRLKHSLKMARYDHVNDKALDTQRERYEKAQEEIETTDKRLGAYFDDAIKDIDQLRRERDGACGHLAACTAERDAARQIAREFHRYVPRHNTSDPEFPCDCAACDPPDWLKG